MKSMQGVTSPSNLALKILSQHLFTCEREEHIETWELELDSRHFCHEGGLR